MTTKRSLYDLCTNNNNDRGRGRKGGGGGEEEGEEEENRAKLNAFVENFSSIDSPLKWSFQSRLN